MDTHMQAQLDHAARQKGFKNYAQYNAWDQNTRQVVMHGDGTPQAAPQTNWLQNLVEQIPLHPAMLFRHISDKMGAAGL